MNHITSIFRKDIEVLNFVASRLLIFKRIDYPILLELLHEKFPDANVAYLMQTLMRQEVIKLDNEHVEEVKRAALAQLLYSDLEFSLRDKEELETVDGYDRPSEGYNQTNPPFAHFQRSSMQ